MSEEEIRAALEGLQDWGYIEGHLSRTIETGDWRATMMMANGIAHLAEAAWHHPTLILDFPRLTVRLMTHDAGGITAKDVELAELIDCVVAMDLSATSLGGHPDGYAAGSPNS